MEQPNYYAIIPANVRYDSTLTANAKLLYGEITALCNKNGYCWATNEYFATLYNVSKVSVSNWISTLIKKGYISKEIIYKEGTKEILNRYLKIIEYPNKNIFNTPIKENFKDNNTRENNNTPYSPPKGEESFSTLDSDDKEDIDEYNFNLIWEDYPRQEGKTKAFGYFRKWIRGRKINGKTIKLTDEQMLKAVRVYAKEKKYTDKKFVQLGSTFFNTTILDYIETE